MLAAGGTTVVSFTMRPEMEGASDVLNKPSISSVARRRLQGVQEAEARRSQEEQRRDDPNESQHLAANTSSLQRVQRDIFISYAHEDRPRAQMLAQTLEDRGWSTFWDRRIPCGKTWRTTIEKEISDARCVIVLWSKASIKSDWVHEEAEDAKRRGILVPALIEDVTPPFGFRSIQTADLINLNWQMEESTEEFRGLIADITGLIEPKS
jgi:hypothetical protein